MLKSRTASKPRINLRVGETIHHWPTLKTVLMVEKAVQKAEKPLSLEALKRALPKKLMDQTLRLILAYLDDKGVIMVGSKGIVWIENKDPKFLRLLERSKGVEL